MKTTFDPLPAYQGEGETNNGLEDAEHPTLMRTCRDGVDKLLFKGP